LSFDPFTFDVRSHLDVAVPPDEESIYRIRGDPCIRSNT